MRGKQTAGVSVLAAAVLAVALAPASGLGAEPIDRDYHQVYVVRQGDRLILDHEDGDLRIEPVDSDTLEIEVHYHATVRRLGFGGKADFSVDFVQKGRTVRVTGHETSSGGLGFFERREQEHLYLVRAPAWLELEITGEDGDVDLQGWRARVDLTTDDGDLDLRDVETERVDVESSDGDLRLEDLRAELTARTDDGDVVLAGGELPRCRLRTADGDVTLGAATGAFEVETRDGDVTARSLRTHKLAVHTRDGDVDVQLRDAGGLDVEIQTGDGNVRLELPPGASTAFRLETGSGEIRSELPESDLSVQESDRVAGAVGRGEGKLEIRTGDGRITLLPGR